LFARVLDDGREPSMIRAGRAERDLHRMSRCGRRFVRIGGLGFLLGSRFGLRWLRSVGAPFFARCEGWRGQCRECGARDERASMGKHDLVSSHYGTLRCTSTAAKMMAPLTIC